MANNSKVKVDEVIEQSFAWYAKDFLYNVIIPKALAALRDILHSGVDTSINQICNNGKLPKPASSGNTNYNGAYRSQVTNATYVPGASYQPKNARKRVPYDSIEFDSIDSANAFIEDLRTKLDEKHVITVATVYEQSRALIEGQYTTPEDNQFGWHSLAGAKPVMRNGKVYISLPDFSAIRKYAD